MYAAVLLLHSWLRWLVLLAAIVVLLRALPGWFGRRAWLPADTTAGRAFVGLLDLQFLLGLLLYALSPLTRTALSDLGSAMRDGLLRYWAVEHAFGMLAALVVAHVGVARARRAASDHARHRGIAIATLLALLLILLTIPWPASEYGRPLLRGF